MTLPSLNDAASFTNATTACVRSSCVTPATGDRSAANAAGSNGRRLSDVGAIAFTPAPGRSGVKAAKPLALSIGVTLSHAEWLCQPPWIRTKTALVADIAESSRLILRSLQPVEAAARYFALICPLACRDELKGNGFKLPCCRKGTFERPSHQAQTVGDPPQPLVPPRLQTPFRSPQGRRNAAFRSGEHWKFLAALRWRRR